MIEHEIAGPVTMPETSRDKALPLTFVIFAIVFAVFLLGPPLLGQAFGLYPLLKVADVFDLVTPLALMPLYWLVFHFAGRRPPTLGENLVFAFLAAVWTLGQGMHLAANSIGHLSGSLKGTDIFTLTRFFDETLSHYFWHSGVIGLSALLIYRQWKSPFPAGPGSPWQFVPAGIIYGFAYFAIIIEGGTAPLGLPFTLLAVTVTGIGWRRQGPQPVFGFSLAAYAAALALFAVWAVWQQGLPQFSEVGIIK